VDEIIAVMRAAGTSPEGVRPRGVVVLLWRAVLRISEAFALNETDLDSRGTAVVIYPVGVTSRVGCELVEGRLPILERIRKPELEILVVEVLLHVRGETAVRARTVLDARPLQPLSRYPSFDTELSRFLAERGAHVRGVNEFDCPSTAQNIGAAKLMRSALRASIHASTACFACGSRLSVSSGWYRDAGTVSVPLRRSY
jgi:hypothetical protein